VTEAGESQLDAVGRILAAAVTDGVPGVAGAGVPGLTAAAGRGPRTLASWALGQTDTTTTRPMQPDTVFDLASLTKVVATTTVTLALAGQGLIGLDDPVVKHLPAATQLATPEVTVRQLLTHTSGLPGSVKFYEWCADRDQLLRELYATPLEVPPGTRVAYSDLGFMMLGQMAAAVTGEPLDTLFRRLVSEPLGMADTGYLSDSPAGGPPPGGPPAGGFAATELRADGTPWIGVVHDENARVMGGVAGHAGLFSTAADLAKFAAWWVGHDDGAGPVPAALRRDSERCQTPGLEGHRGLGWVRIGDRYDILGEAWPDSAVSHTGFTGTSLALDAPSGVWVVLLTNDVHYGRGRAVIRPLREGVHAAVAAALF
jgi:CubicO group peptidase (beta-lactamase class C family)